MPITKEEVLAIKEELKALNEKPVKKVLEARFRKKRKLEKQLRKFKKGAEEIYEGDALDERGKHKEIAKLRHKIVTAERSKNTKKKIVVGKKFKSAAPGSSTIGNKYRVVDRRSKKELRAEKRLKRKGKFYNKTGKKY